MWLSERLNERRLKSNRIEYRRGYDYGLGRIIADKASAIEMQAEYDSPRRTSFDLGIIDAVDTCVRMKLLEDNPI